MGVAGPRSSTTSNKTILLGPEGRREMAYLSQHTGLQFYMAAVFTPHVSYTAVKANRCKGTLS